MIRTCDTRFRKPLLYPLSYEGERSYRILIRGGAGDEYRSHGQGKLGCNALPHVQASCGGLGQRLV